MIWGEVVNAVRSLNNDLLEQFGLDPKICTKDVDLDTAGFPYPTAIDDFDEWDEYHPAPALEDILPLHPVERALIEGPLLPIQKIGIKSRKEIEVLFAFILKLEKEWCKKTGVSTPATAQFLENACTVRALKLSTTLGFNKLAAT